jgi:hypothetical protein
VKKIDVDKFKTLFTVSDDGSLVWKVNRGGGVKAGDIAGCITSNGYRQVYVDNVPYYAHRIVLALHLGRDVGSVDHIDGNRSNNEATNLRELSKADNAKNRVGTGCSSTPWGWAAALTTNYVKMHLGYFDTEEAARTAYLKAKEVYHTPAHNRIAGAA